MTSDLPFGLTVTASAPASSTVEVSGELDLVAVPHLNKALGRHLGCDITVVMRNVTFIDSTALQCLLRLHRESQDHGGSVRVTDPSPTVARVFELAGVDSILLAD